MIVPFSERPKNEQDDIKAARRDILDEMDNIEEALNYYHAVSRGAGDIADDILEKYTELLAEFDLMMGIDNDE